MVQNSQRTFNRKAHKESAKDTKECLAIFATAFRPLR